MGFSWHVGAQEPTDTFFGEEVDVRVVNLEVVVEDRAGNRVHGLEADDFRLLVDGHEVDIEYFTEVAGRRARTSGSAGTPPAIGEGETVATNYVLFVDDDHTHPTFRRPVLFGFRDRLARLPAADQVAVVAQSGRQLEIVSPFTTDREATRAALREFDKGGRFAGFLRARQRHRGDAGPSGAVPLAGTVRGAIDSEPLVPTGSYLGAGALAFPARWPGSGGGRMGAVYAEGIGSFGLDGLRSPEIAFRDLRFSVDAVVSTMRALEPPPGRKVFLLLAGSWPSGNFGRTGLGSGKSTDLHLLDALIDTANLLGYTLYPMDQQRQPRGWLWQNLRYVARGTGGRAFMAGTNVRALDIVNADTSHYYWLGFVPRYQRDDEAHDVRIEVERPRLRVRSRRGYLDLSRRTEADMEALRELLFPAESEPAGGALLVEIGDTDRLKRRMMSVPVGVYLPVGRFLAVPHDGRFVQDLEVRFAAVDRWGRRTGVPVQRVRLGGPSLPAADEVVLYRTSLALRRLAHDLVVTVHDPLSRETASTRMRVAPQEAEPNP
ncbi:MAG: VWA domain-containing protein [Holophagales bacterium]|nr:VWA domain-containing protein [Holophagales bacterium]MYG28945.1 VWA domain-containing protein [Holophagales bacterium]MYI80735.1 VWA domain-containing protein [Holophagales bacterium]